MEPTYAAKEGKDEAGAEKRGGAGGGGERRARGRSDETTERQEKGGRRMEGDETTVVKWMRRAKERRKGEKKRKRWRKEGRSAERGGQAREVKHEERALSSTPRMAEGQTGKKKEDATWQGGEVKLDTKSSKKN